MENLTSKQRIILIIVGIIVIGMFIFYMSSQTRGITKDDTVFEDYEMEELGEVTKEKIKIIVHITGAIQEEGIVELEEGARIKNAIEEAGGLTEDADLSNVNLAYQLKDGQKIYIPRIADIEEVESIILQNGEEVILDNEENVNEGVDEKVNINTATSTQLETLPGIGSETAKKIIEYRQNNGEFKKIEDIKNVSGIGETKFEKIKDSIIV